MRKTPWQLFRFAFVYLSAQPTGFLITPLLWNSEYLGWMSILAGSAMSLILLWFTIRLGMWSPNTSWVDFGERLVGKWVHTMIILLLLFWSINYIALDIEGFTLFFNTNYMRESPQWIIQIIIGLVVIITARWGLETMIYMSDGLFILSVLSIVLVNIFFFKNSEFEMLPALITHHNYGSAATDAVYCLSFFAEWVVFLFIAPYIQIDRRAFRNLACSGLLVALAVLLQWLAALLNFGPYFGRELQYPLVELMRSTGGFLGKSDPLMIGLWSSSMFMHSAFLLHVSVKCLGKVLNLKKMDNPLISLVGGTSVVIAYQYSRNPTLFQENYDSVPMIAFFLTIEAIPLLYWLAILLRPRKRKRRTA
ncbi:GerAB/ArcD/ProY family transporter [Paenibacillus sp. FSL W7-1279]|uniref:GerAB/ArcD/ProY family transporter n=1 Tax=Paenibacillus TaxID=44249 RepID=UPI00188B3BB4|nr:MULTISPECIES: GerAB/ArcD/ProY family transporter [Paenibacillus]MBX4146608.1 GerAB/ArcD/ProY family transporter [Paenibacillus lautus]